MTHVATHYTVVIMCKMLNPMGILGCIQSFLSICNEYPTWLVIRRVVFTADEGKACTRVCLALQDTRYIHDITCHVKIIPLPIYEMNTSS